MNTNYLDYPESEINYCDCGEEIDDNETLCPQCKAELKAENKND